eukprot:1150409-Pelagomonas_calceolata.AAC.2
MNTASRMESTGEPSCQLEHLIANFTSMYTTGQTPLLAYFPVKSDLEHCLQATIRATSLRMILILCMSAAAGVPGRIHVSETTHRLLQHAERWESTGGVEVKGKGQMQTYLWVPPSDRPAESQRISLPSSDSVQINHLKRTCTLLQSMQLPTSCPLPMVKLLP